MCTYVRTMITTNSAIYIIFTFVFNFFECTDGEDIQNIFTPDYTYITQTKSFYKIHSNELNFTDARAKCESEGASLWYPADQAEAEAVVNLWKEEIPLKNELLIGITDLELRGNYQTIDHRPIHEVFNKWETGEPNNGRGIYGEERCLIIRKQVVINDHRCTATFPFVCTKNPKYLQCTKKGEAVKSGEANYINRMMTLYPLHIIPGEAKYINRMMTLYPLHIIPGEANYKFSPKGYTYLKKSHSFYKVHTVQKTVVDAEETCKMEGASFWYPENQEEADQVIAFWNQVQPNFIWVYIAVTDLKTKGVYETNDGRSLDDVYNKWGPGEPNDGGNYFPEERCVILRREGVLNDHLCDRTFPFICKRSLDSLDCTYSGQVHTHIATNNYYPKDYTYIEEMKSFYKIHTIQRNVTDAEIQCKKEGATFWYPKDKVEADAVIALWHQQQPNFVWVYIAVNDLKTKGVFQTIDDRSLDDVYNKWGPGEPDDGGTTFPEERCVILRREGVLNDHLCDQMFPFICKKSLGSTCNYKCDLPNHGSQITKNFFRKDYTYLDKTKSFYKIHTIQRDVFDAEKRCKSEGATFWYPENQAEVDAVRAFWGVNQPTFDWVYVAISNLKTKGIYLTNDGRPIDDVYNVWAVGEPNDGHDYFAEERCIILRKEGVYNDHLCDRNFPFICKKTLDSFCIDQCNNPQAINLTNPQTSRPLDIITSITTSVQCGVIDGGNHRPLIFNGLSYARGEWPWVVAIYRKKHGSLSYICAGTLVSDRHVVTAAHCMKLRNKLTSKRDVIVKVGVYDLEDWGDDISVPRNIAVATIHENYNASTLAHDIMVLTLTRSVEFNTNIRPACLWSGNPDLTVIVGASGVVAGWGQSELGPEGEGEPRIVRLPVVTTAACRASRPDFHKLTSEFTLCAGDRNGAGPCLGDSGGGFYMSGDGRWQLRGIVSLSLRPDNGDSTCNLSEYIVFTDAAKYVDWIRNILVANKPLG